MARIEIINFTNTNKNNMSTKSPNNKMIGETPNKKQLGKKVKKNETKKEIKDEKAQETTQESAELKPEERKQVEVVETAIIQKTDALEVFKNLTRGQIDLIKRTVAKNATDDELQMFLQVCTGAGLNPFLRQVHFVKYGSTANIIVGIDGFRAIADRTGAYAGSDDAIIDEDEQDNPTKATVTVHKLVQGGRYSFTATARFKEYTTSKNKWQTMPHTMIAKCAEALALRKAFPQQLSSLYTPEEMDQAKKPEITADQLIDKVKKAIGQIKDTEQLDQLEKDIASSKKYNDKQKKEIIEAITKQRNET